MKTLSTFFIVLSSLSAHASGPGGPGNNSIESVLLESVGSFKIVPVPHGCSADASECFGLVLKDVIATTPGNETRKIGNVLIRRFEWESDARCIEELIRSKMERRATQQNDIAPSRLQLMSPEQSLAQFTSRPDDTEIVRVGGMEIRPEDGVVCMLTPMKGSWSVGEWSK